LRLLLRLLDDPLPLLVDALRGPDLLGHGDAQLVDQVEGRVAVDDRVPRQRQGLAVGDQRFESLDEKDDVQRTAPVGFAPRRGFAVEYGTVVPSRPGGQPRSAVRGRRAASASRAARGTIPETSP